MRSRSRTYERLENARSIQLKTMRTAKNSRTERTVRYSQEPERPRSDRSLVCLSIRIHVREKIRLEDAKVD